MKIIEILIVIAGSIFTVLLVLYLLKINKEIKNLRLNSRKKDKELLKLLSNKKNKI